MNFSSKSKKQQTKTKQNKTTCFFFNILMNALQKVVLMASIGKSRSSLQGALEGIVREWVRASIYRHSITLTVSPCLLTLSQLLLLCQSDSLHFRLCLVPAEFFLLHHCALKWLKLSTEADLHSAELDSGWAAQINQMQQVENNFVGCKNNVWVIKNTFMSSVIKYLSKIAVFLQAIFLIWSDSQVWGCFSLDRLQSALRHFLDFGLHQ